MFDLREVGWVENAAISRHEAARLVCCVDLLRDSVRTWRKWAALHLYGEAQPANQANRNQAATALNGNEQARRLCVEVIGQGFGVSQGKYI